MKQMQLDHDFFFISQKHELSNDFYEMKSSPISLQSMSVLILTGNTHPEDGRVLTCGLVWIAQSRAWSWPL